MKYLLCNFYVNDNSLIEQTFTNEIFKSVAYNAKLKDKRTKQCGFTYVMIPVQNYLPTNELDDVISYAKEHTNVPFGASHDEILKYYSIRQFLGENANLKYTFDIINIIDSSDCDIFYSDGSSCRANGMASYATIKLLGESFNPEDVYEDITQTTQKIEQFSGSMENGTNNIGELTGVKVAVEKAGNKQIQILVSDSEYSLKCFREWIYNWKQNGYKASNKKQILNCDLIKAIQSLIENSGKVYLFRWTKGHADTPLNEMCDELAKKELGIEKE